MLQLIDLQDGEKAEVLTTYVKNRTDSHSERSRGLAKSQLRAGEMGLRPGSTIEVLSRRTKGPLLVESGNLKIAISHSMATEMTVRRILN